MAGITLAAAQTQLDAWIAASAAVAKSQSYTIDTGNGQRSLTRADAEQILKQITFWDTQVKRLSSSRGRTRYLVPE